MSQQQFLEDIKKIKADARKNLKQGAITNNYGIDLETVLSLLNGALATEIICTLRYKQHYYKASELGASVASAEFLEHANQEDQHATQLAERIAQLGGQPNLNPNTLVKNAHADYVECDNVADMIKENLVAERIAIDSYREIIKYVGNNDSTTRVMLEGILSTEEEHADDLLDLAAEYNVEFQD